MLERVESRIDIQWSALRSKLRIHGRSARTPRDLSLSFARKLSSRSSGSPASTKSRDIGCIRIHASHESFPSTALPVETGGRGFTRNYQPPWTGPRSVTHFSLYESDAGFSDLTKPSGYPRRENAFPTCSSCLPASTKSWKEASSRGKKSSRPGRKFRFIPRDAIISNGGKRRTFIAIERIAEHEAIVIGRYYRGAGLI